MEQKEEKRKIDWEWIILALILIAAVVLAFLPKKIGLASYNSETGKITNPHTVRKDKDVVRIAVEETYYPLNPFFESTKENSLFTRLIHKTLAKKTKDGTIEMDLADQVWVDNEGKDLCISLKRGQTFPNGREIVASDIERNIRVLTDPTYDGPKSFYVEGISGYYQYKMKNDEDALDITIENDYFIRIAFNKASKDNLRILEMPIVELYDEMFSYGNLEELRTSEFSTGAGNYTVYAAEDGRYDFVNNPNAEGVVEKISVESSPYFQARHRFMQGDVDILYKYPMEEFKNNDLPQASKEISYFIKNQNTNFIKMAFNIKDGFFSNADLRQGLKSSIDFSGILGLSEDEKIDGSVYKNSRFYKANDYVFGNLSLKDMTIDKPSKLVTMAIYNKLDDVNGLDDAFVEAFKSQGLVLKISHIDDSELYELMAGKNKYDIFLAPENFITIPSVINQGIYDSDGNISVNAIDDKKMIKNLDWIGKVQGYENYSYAILWWQDWYYENLPYIVLKGKNEMTAINNRLSGLYINEFVGIDDISNLKALKNVLK